MNAPTIVENVRALKFKSCRVIVGREPAGVDGAPLWHISISHPARYPHWDEIKTARMRYVPQSVVMAMLLPGEADYVNLHPNCFHLWEIKAEELPPHIVVAYRGPQHD